MSRGNTSEDSHASYCINLNEQRRRRQDPSMVHTLIDDIMKKYLCTKNRQGSSCSLFSHELKSVYSVDKRLDYWTKILEERKKLACRIKKVTGKRISHILYNQTEDFRCAQNVKRIVDTAEKLDPTKLPTKKIGYLKRTCLYETLPRYQRTQKPDIEIIEMPKYTRTEQWIRERPNGYLSSKYLHKKIGDTSYSKIIEYYPETSGLQIIGKRIHKHKERIELDSGYKLSAMSSESFLERIDFPEYCMQVNENIIHIDDHQFKPLKFNVEFKSQPIESQTIILCRIRNNGRKPILCSWKRKTPIGFSSKPTVEPTFFFNQGAFRLNYDDNQIVEVTFKPTREYNFEEYWQLVTKPHFFPTSKHIQLHLTGESVYPRDMFSTVVEDIIEKIILEILPGEVRKKAILTDEDLFEKYNPGLCAGRENIVRFQEIFRQFKDKNHPTWDYKLESLAILVESCPNYIQRQQGLLAMNSIIREIRMKCSFCDVNVKNKIAKNVFITFMDKWEESAIKTVHSVSTTDIDSLLIKMPFMLEKVGKVHTLNKKRKIIQNEALYFQMYCCLCDSIDEIVLFIHNCVLLEKSV